ncbi:MAG: ShlB/FhaC/HecB family hemolysin secretion/activation protein [Cyanobacteria bacterium J06621_8]
MLRKVFWFLLFFSPPLLLHNSVIAQQESTSVVNTSIIVNRILVEGSSILENEIENIVKPVEGRQVNFDHLHKVAISITNLYVEKGYITSGAYLPEQEIVDGLVRIKVIEGKLEEVQIQGLKHLNSNYVRSLVGNLSAPVNINRLENDLGLLQRSPSIEDIKADLVRGTDLRSSILLLEIEERSPWNLKSSLDNYRSSSVGELQGTLEVDYRNLIGIDDQIFTRYDITEGFDSFSTGIEIPLSPNYGKLIAEYRVGDSKIISDFLADVGIRAESQSFRLDYIYPIVSQSSRDISLGLGFERLSSKTFILDDEPFSFIPGPDDGESVVSSLTLTSSWIERFPNSVLRISSKFKFGTDFLGATVNDNAPDGLFFSWLGEAQFTQALNSSRDLLLVTRLATQLSTDSLLPLEQFTLGGSGTVRGYVENQEVGDNGVVGTIEALIPVVKPSASNKLSLVPFFDGGVVWSNDQDDFVSLASFGLGLAWEFRELLSLQIDWGLPLINDGDQDDSLQANGLSFSLRVKPF